MSMEVPGYDINDSEIDEFGRKTTEAMERMLGALTLSKEKSWDRTVKNHEAQKKTLEQAKAMGLDTPVVEKPAATNTLRTAAPEQGVSLEKGIAPTFPAQEPTPWQHTHNGREEYFTQEYRRIERLNPGRSENAIRDMAITKTLLNVSFEEPASTAVHKKPDTSKRLGQAREIDARGIERTRE